MRAHTQTHTFFFSVYSLHPPVSSSQVLGLQMCPTTPGSVSSEPAEGSSPRLWGKGFGSLFKPWHLSVRDSDAVPHTLAEKLQTSSTSLGTKIVGIWPGLCDSCRGTDIRGQISSRSAEEWTARRVPQRCLGRRSSQLSTRYSCKLLISIDISPASRW